MTKWIIILPLVSLEQQRLCIEIIYLVCITKYFILRKNNKVNTTTDILKNKLHNPTNLCIQSFEFPITIYR